MNVKELIEKLQKYPPDMRVVFEDISYEEGYIDPFVRRVTAFRTRPSESGWLSNHSQGEGSVDVVALLSQYSAKDVDELT